MNTWKRPLIARVLALCVRIILNMLVRLPYFKFIRETRHSQVPITFFYWFFQKVLGVNGSVYWPVHRTSTVIGWKNIYAGIETCPGYMQGCYIQGIGKIYIGDYTQIGPNVGIISANHDAYDVRSHTKGEVRIGRYCWLGMNSVVLPNVILGDFTIVGAGSIVTKSFPEGHCIIGGNPAKVLKKLDKNKCIRYESEFRYNGYIPASEYEKFKQEALNI